MLRSRDDRAVSLPVLPIALQGDGRGSFRTAVYHRDRIVRGDFGMLGQCQEISRKYGGKGLMRMGQKQWHGDTVGDPQ